MTGAGALVVSSPVPRKGPAEPQHFTAPLCTAHAWSVELAAMDVTPDVRPVTSITRLYSAERYGPTDRVLSDEVQDQADTAWSDARASILRRWRRRFMFWKRRDE